jgi:type I restriction enzyme S subunit
MSWKKVKIKEVLKQYRVQHIVQDSIEYKQVSILNDGSVVLRGNKIGKEIGRKRQFKIDLRTYPDTLIFTRQLLLQGSIGIASEDVNDCIVTENMPMFSIQTSKIDKEFLILFLKSEVFKSRIRKIELSGSAQKSIHEKTFLDLEFLIPDINLQKIIVVELLKLKSNGDTISTELTHQLSLIKQMRQAFLREAMQGKLVKSTNTKETGKQLLAKIKAEKTQLIAEKKLKKEKELAPISEDEIPFEIPEHWAWCRLGEISNIQRGSSPRPKGDSRYFAKSQTSFNWITISDISSFCEGNKLKQTKEHLTEEGSKHSRFVDENEFIIAVSGSTTGKCCLTGIDGYIYDGLAVVKQINKNLPSEFLMNYMTYLYAHINNSKSGASFPNINTDFLNNLIYPLPPLHEQEQIVTKLEDLMVFCDGLEQSIKESQRCNEMLLQQVLREALQGEKV